MLEFWFNPDIHFGKKLLLLLVLIALAAVLYSLDPLPFDAILMFCATGIVFLICRYCNLHFFAQKNQSVAARLLKWIPIALLLALIFMQLQHGEILLRGAQGIAFMAIAICIFSPLSLFNQHPTPPHA